MKRLTYIYCIAPLTVALNTLPGMLGIGYPGLIVAVVLAVAVWALVWFRIYHTGRLRPEFAVLTVVPVLSYYFIQAAGVEYIQIFNSPIIQNFNFLLWLGSIFVYIRSFLPAPQEYRGRLATDSVFIFMSIISTVYGLSCWATTHAVS